MRPRSHPRDLLLKEHLEPYGLEPSALITPITEFLEGARELDTYLAKVLATFTGTTVTFWVNAELNYRGSGAEPK